MVIDEANIIDWAIVLKSGALWRGREFREYKVFDYIYRDDLEVEVSYNLSDTRATLKLERIAVLMSRLRKLRLYSEPSLPALVISNLTGSRQIALFIIEPNRQEWNGSI